MNKIERPTKEDIISYYIDTDITAREAAVHYGMSEVVFRRTLREYGIHKNAEQKRITHLKHVQERKHKKPTKDELIEYYITLNHSKKECIKYFNVSSTTFSRWLNDYHILKPKDKKIERFVIGQSYKRYQRPDLTQLQENYLDTTLTRDQAAKKFGVSLSTFSRWLTEFGVTKTSDQIQKTIQQSFLDHYGQPWAHTENIQHYDIWVDKAKFVSYLDNLITKPTVNDLMHFFNVGSSSIARKIQAFDCKNKINLSPARSQYEDQIATVLGVCELNAKGIIDPYEIDLYYPDKNIGIEFNGDYWHSDLFKDKYYHFNKSLLAEQRGIRLIHIFENEWNDPIKQKILISMLKIALGQTKSRIYARQCEVREISNNEAREFNEQNHLQGHRNAQVTYGLFYKNKLVQLMSFSKTRYNRNLSTDNSWEIIRGCPGSNNIVVGGVSKLFKHFVKNYEPDEVFSYCEFNKFDGRGYEALGMKMIGYTGPNMLWLMNNGKVINRSPKRHKELQESSVGKIWGAGSKKYLWTNPNNNN